MAWVLRVWNGIGRKAALQGAHEEEPQTGCLGHDRTYRQFAFMQQIRLVLTDVVGAELIWWLAEWPAKRSTAPMYSRIVSEEKFRRWSCSSMILRRRVRDLLVTRPTRFS